jgi:hypothetical protein
VASRQLSLQATLSRVSHSLEATLSTAATLSVTLSAHLVCVCGGRGGGGAESVDAARGKGYGGCLGR